ncbi:MAG TPA: MFS transporter, partial [Arthrobacter sp.]|nr:MFS transporter [Arthrobacter sp.]
MSLSDIPGAVPDPGLVGTTRPAAIAEPTERVRPLWITGVVLVNLGINAAFFGPIQVLLAQQSEHFDPGQKEAIFALVNGA